MSWNQPDLLWDRQFIRVLEVLLILQKVNKVFKWAFVDCLRANFADTFVFAALHVVVKIAHCDEVLFQLQNFAFVNLIRKLICLWEIPSFNTTCYHFHILIFSLPHWDDLLGLFLRISHVLIFMLIRVSDSRSFHFFKTLYLFLFLFDEILFHFLCAFGVFEFVGLDLFLLEVEETLE